MKYPMSNGSTHAFFVISKEKFKTTLQCIPTKYLNWTQFSIAFETKQVFMKVKPILNLQPKDLIYSKKIIYKMKLA